MIKYKPNLENLIMKKKKGNYQNRSLILRNPLRKKKNSKKLKSFSILPQKKIANNFFPNEYYSKIL